MATPGQPIPEGFSTLTPHLTVRNAAAAIEFYKKAFNAEPVGRAHLCPDGKTIMHAEMKIGNSMVMLNDEMPDMGSLSPLSKEGAGVCMHIYVKDVDKLTKQAIDAGATVTMPVADMFWGDRYGRIKDPFGHHWSIATHKEDVTDEEMEERAAAMFAKGG